MVCELIFYLSSTLTYSRANRSVPKNVDQFISSSRGTHDGVPQHFKDFPQKSHNFLFRLANHINFCKTTDQSR